MSNTQIIIDTRNQVLEDAINELASGGDYYRGFRLLSDQDGPYVRFAAGETKRLEFAGWSGDGPEDVMEAYHIDDYFDDDGWYRGPDDEGVYPLFSVVCGVAS